MEKPKSLKTNIFLLTVSIIIGMFFVEVLAEYVIFYRYGKKNEQHKPFYQWATYTSEGLRLGNRQGMLKLMLHPQLVYVNFPSQKTPYFSINSKGFRGPEIKPKTVGYKRVIVVGGSAAFGTGLNSDSETFSANLEKKLQNTEVINASVIGYRSGQELTYLLIELIDLEPDLIIAFDGYNDLGRTAKKWCDVNGSWRVQRELNKLNRLVYGPLVTRWSNIDKVIFSKTIYLLNEGLNKIRRRKYIKMGNENLDTSISTFTYVRNILKMNRLAKAFKAEFICVIQPAKSSIAGKDNLYNRCRAEAKRYLDQYGTEYIDLNDYTSALAPDMFMDELHLDEQGHRVVADILAEKICEKQLLQNEGKKQ